MFVSYKHEVQSRKIKKGGKSFFSYGRVYYRDYAIRLRGRLQTTQVYTHAADMKLAGIPNPLDKL